jgi:cytochrome c oxidase subunit 3
VNRRELQNNLAMSMVLISAAMLFTTLLMGYSLYRANSPVWPPMGSASIPLGFPLLSSASIFLSSIFCYQVKSNVKQGDFKTAGMNLNTTLALGVVFMVIQGLFWQQMKNAGIYSGSGIFASIIYGFTWIHAAHVVMGIFSLCWLRWNLNPETPNMLQKTINVEKFWHFLGVVWLIMFLTLFVL